MDTINVNVRDDKLASDCLDSLVAFPLAIQRMRESSDSTSIPKRMQSHTERAFEALDAAKRDCLLIAAGATDQLYRYCISLKILDKYTRDYTAIAVRELYLQLSMRQVKTFYVLDNSLRQDRFMSVMELFSYAGVKAFSPNTHGVTWDPISKEIEQAAAMPASHIAYIEPDATANHLASAITLAKRLNSVATFRNEAPENLSLGVICLPSSIQGGA